MKSLLNLEYYKNQTETDQNNPFHNLFKFLFLSSSQVDIENYIRTSYLQGRDMLTLRNALLNQGHSKEEIDPIIDKILHHASISKRGGHKFLIGILLIILVSGIGLGAFLLFQQQDKEEAPIPPLAPNIPKPSGFCGTLANLEQERCLRKYIEDGGVCLRLEEDIRYACYRTRDIIILETYYANEST